MRVLFALSLLLCAAWAAIDQDAVVSLPGWDKPLPSAHYSGYLTIDAQSGRRLHYWLVLSENNPSLDPLILWMNGGPGCSSLDGFFYEHGPFHFVNDSTSSFDPSNIQLEVNPYRWNRIANVLFVEAPAGVGFSYSDTPSDYKTNDTRTAQDNFQMLQVFFQNFPELSLNDFYVSGESYAGVYVPTLVQQIMENNDAGRSNINLKGFLVGNGCTGSQVGICSPQGTKISVDYLYGHGLYSSALHSQLYSTCTDFANPSPACSKLLTQMGQEVGKVNIYNIYGDCIIGGQKVTHSNSSHSRVFNHPLKQFGVSGPVECIDGISASAYLNQDSVRTAIHVLPRSRLPTWAICTALDYTSNVASLYPIYPTLIKRYRTLIYNGDADACVPYTDNETWTSSLGFAVQEAWRPWMVDDQVAGFVVKYDTNNFTFLTVKGAGHMVPQFKPAQAFAMLQRFLNQQPF